MLLPGADSWLSGRVDGRGRRRAGRLVAVRHAIALLQTEGHTRRAGPAVTDPGFVAEALLAPLATAPAQRRNHRYHAVRGHLLAMAGRMPEALSALATAARMTRSDPEQRYLDQVLSRLRVENGQQSPHPSSPEGVEE